MRAALATLLSAAAAPAATQPPETPTPPPPPPREACDVAVAGAGPGGIYFAWRVLVEHAAQRVCIFERSQRAGGRVLSLRRMGPRRDLTVDLGAYRYAAEPMVEGLYYHYTPLTAAVIQAALGLRTAEYDPGDVNSTMRKIVDSDGENLGYGTFVDAMLTEVRRRGGEVSFGDAVVGLTDTAGGGTLLRLRSGRSVRAGTVLLNLPQIPLLRLLRMSPGIAAAASPALQAPIPADGVKLYVYYDDAWWRNLLGLESGVFQAGSLGVTHVSSSSHTNITTPDQLPGLLGRYHDGHVRCGEGGGGCYGYLEAMYTYGESTRWFVTHIDDADPPYVQLNASLPGDRAALDEIHRVLLDYHLPQLRNASARTGSNATAAVARLRPASALLSYWGGQAAGYGGAVHITKTGDIPVSRVASAALRPFGARRVFVANEAFGALRGTDGALGAHHGWAECSLVMAENALAAAFALPPPSWIDRAVYDEFVRFNASRPGRGGWRQG